MKEVGKKKATGKNILKKILAISLRIGEPQYK